MAVTPAPSSRSPVLAAFLALAVGAALFVVGVADGRAAENWVDRDELKDELVTTTPSAIDELISRAKVSPKDAGVRLELFLAWCQAGDRERALNALRDLRALGPMPAGIEGLIAFQLRQECKTGQGPWFAKDGKEDGKERDADTSKSSEFKRDRSVTVSLGRQDNLNAAPHPEGLSLGQGGSLGYYTFSPASRPKSDGFLEVLAQSAGSMGPIPYLGSGLSYQIHGSVRRYRSEADYSATHLGGQVAYAPSAHEILSLSLIRWWLGSHAYESSVSANYSLSQDWLGTQSVFFIEAIASMLDKASAFNSHTLSVGLASDPKAEGLTWAMAGGWDRAIDNRPGGDRSVFKLGVGWRGFSALGRTEAWVIQTRSGDQEGYNAELFGPVKRLHDETDVFIRQIWPELNGVAPFFQFKATRSRDRIALFEVRSQVVQFGFVQHF